MDTCSIICDFSIPLYGKKLFGFKLLIVQGETLVAQNCSVTFYMRLKYTPITNDNRSNEDAVREED